MKRGTGPFLFTGFLVLVLAFLPTSATQQAQLTAEQRTTADIFPKSPAYLSEWVYTGGPIGGLGYDIRMDPRNPDIMYVSDAWAGVFKSVDGGENWFPSNNGLPSDKGPSADGIPVFCLSLDPNNPDRVWVGTEMSSGIYLSTNGGESWELRNNGVQEQFLTVRGFAIKPGNSNVVYMAAELPSFEWNGSPLEVMGLDVTMGVVYKTTDGGLNWTRLWLGDNLARYIWIHPENHDLIFVSTGIFDRAAANSNSNPGSYDPGGIGILRSFDGGLHWEVLGTNQGFHPDDLYIGSLYMHPVDPSTLLAAAGNDPFAYLMNRPMGGIYITRDFGNTWVEAIDGGNFSAVEICETEPMRMYAASLSQFHRSTDGGETWQKLQEGYWGSADSIVGFPIDMQCDPRNPDKLFVNAYGGGNFLTEDGGFTWRTSSQGYTGALTRQVSVARGLPALIFASARSGIFASASGGSSWSGMSYGSARAMEGIGMAVNPANPNHLLATVGDAGPQAQLSFDRGRVWESVGSELWSLGTIEEGESFTRFYFLPTHPSRILATVGFFGCYIAGDCSGKPGSGVVISTDQGRSWRFSSLSEGIVRSIAFHVVGDHAIVYAAVIGQGLYRSDDSGENWYLVNENPRPPSITLPEDPGAINYPHVASLAVDPTNPERIYAGYSFNAIGRSEDGGLTWKLSSNGLSPEASVVAIETDPNRPGVFYAGSANTGVYYTDDWGEIWNEKNDGLFQRTVQGMDLSSDGTVLYLATDGAGIFRLGEPVFPIFLPMVQGELP